MAAPLTRYFFSADEWALSARRSVASSRLKVLVGGIEAGVPIHRSSNGNALRAWRIFLPDRPLSDGCPAVTGFTSFDITARDLPARIAAANGEAAKRRVRRSRIAADAQDGFLQGWKRTRSIRDSSGARLFISFSPTLRRLLRRSALGGNRGMRWKWIASWRARDFTDWITGWSRYPYVSRDQRSARLMAERRKRVDAVIIGYGWAGAIMARRSLMPACRS